MDGPISCSLLALEREEHQINWLTLFEGIIAVCSENHMKPTDTLCGQNTELLTVDACGTYRIQVPLGCKRVTHILMRL
jgi:hypothetical protein